MKVVLVIILASGISSLFVPSKIVVEYESMEECEQERERAISRALVSSETPNWMLEAFMEAKCYELPTDESTF